MKLLGIETSCDETAAAVVEDGAHVLSSVVYSQIAQHEEFGGVVPEIASRAHLDQINSVVTAALDQAGLPGASAVDAIAVTARPGLIGSLLVGVSFAKGLAVASRRPLVAVDHIEGHIYANLLSSPTLKPPFVALVVSGGHTAIYSWHGPGSYECLGRTRDDAAGEAFDKASALLGLGYPGGPAIEKAARDGNPKAIRFPRARVKKGKFDFSFSGLKTAVLYHVRGQDGRRDASWRQDAGSVADVAASFQEAVCDVLSSRTLAAARHTGATQLAVGGGVACNGRLRELISQRAKDIDVVFPSPALCTDNAAMIAGLGFHKLQLSQDVGMSFDACPR